MRPVPWWLFAWIFAASVILLMLLGLLWAQIIGTALLLAASAVVTLRERQR